MLIRPVYRASWSALLTGAFCARAGGHLEELKHVGTTAVHEEISTQNMQSRNPLRYGATITTAQSPRFASYYRSDRYVTPWPAVLIVCG